MVTLCPYSMGMLRGMRARLGDISNAVQSSKNDKASKDPMDGPKQDGEGMEIDGDEGYT